MNGNAMLPLALMFLLNSGSMPDERLSTLRRELDTSDSRGNAYAFLGGSSLELKHAQGMKNRFPLDPLLNPHQPFYTGRPTLTIDLRTIDTSQYNWKYRYVNEIPITAVEGYVLPHGDLNGNGLIEVYGIYQSETVGLFQS